jgi:hypothetical protein
LLAAPDDDHRREESGLGTELLVHGRLHFWRGKGVVEQRRSRQMGLKFMCIYTKTPIPFGGFLIFTNFTIYL